MAKMAVKTFLCVATVNEKQIAVNPVGQEYPWNVLHQASLVWFAYRPNMFSCLIIEVRPPTVCTQIHREKWLCFCGWLAIGKRYECGDKHIFPNNTERPV